MRHIFRRITLVVLSFSIILNLTGCHILLNYDPPSILKSTGGASPLYMTKPILLYLESNKVIYDKTDVTLDAYYGLCRLDDKTLEEYREYLLTWDKRTINAFYIGNEAEIVFEEDDGGNVINHENPINAKLVKWVTYEDKLEIDYGFKEEGRKFKYNYKEDLTIPEEYFVSPKGYVYIHIFCWTYDMETEKIIRQSYHGLMEIRYKLIGEDKVVLLDH